MADQPPYVDGFSSFELGINSGIAPLLLAKNQLAFAINATVRGNYITHRPCYRKVALTFPDQATQDFFESRGLWQGGCFFQSEFGAQAMVVSIGGRLFQVVPGDGATAAVTDVSIPGDLNNSGLPIAWLWQSERWVIVQDGQDIPIFYDGQTSRRSLGASQALGCVTADFTVPAIGASVNVTLPAPYTGPVNQAIFVDNAFYQVNSSGLGYGVTLKNLSDSAGGTVAAGQMLLIPSNFIGLTSSSSTVGGSPDHNITFLFGSAVNFSPGVITARKPDGGTTYSNFTTSAHGPSTSLFCNGGTLGDNFPANTQIYQGYFASSGSAGTLAANFINPAVGATVDTFLTTPYNGALGQKVVINGGLYEITATNNTPVPSTTISITNINDTATDRGPTHGPDLGCLSTIPEIQTGRMGAYGLGRNWYSLPDGRSYRATDIVGSSSGSPALQNRDAVLKETQNTFLTSGDFVIPGNIGDIRSMTFTATLDSSLGQGPLQVGTPNTIFSCNAPLVQSGTGGWQTMENPIQTQSLKGVGPLNQYGTILVNSDMFFRSNLGWGSLILARREFATWGNTPISREVQRVVNQDDPALLGFGSAIQFENRFLATSKPTQSASGVYHQGTVALNFEPISGIAQKAPPVYDGLWTGVNTFLWITGTFNQTQRAFAFSYNADTGKIELYELLSDGEAIADHNSVADIPITWQFETGMLFKTVKNKGQFDLCKLIDGELYVAEVADRVGFEVFYRSQFDPCWQTWTAFSICANQTPENAQQENRVLLGLGKPPVNACDPANNRPYFVGETFQFKIKITGHCKFYGMVVKAAHEPKAYFTKAVCGDQDCKVVQCPAENDYAVYQLQDIVIPPTPVIFNQTVYFVHRCNGGLAFTGTFPFWISLDTDNDRLVGASGVFSGDSQEAANIAAQNAINAFGQAALADGSLFCLADMLFVPTEVTGWNAAQDGIAFAEDVPDGLIFGISGLRAYSSSDGTNWTQLGLHGISNPQGMVRASGNFIVPGNTPNRMWRQLDPQFPFTPVAYPGGNAMEAVASGAGKVVAVGSAGGVDNCITSTNTGASWSNQTIAGMTHPRSVAFGAGLFVAVGQNSEIFSSPDGITWTVRLNLGVSNFWSVAFVNSLFIVGGNSGAVYTSPDGLVWTSVGPIGAADVRAVGGGNGAYVICNSIGEVYSSRNGTVWALTKTDPGARLPFQQSIGLLSTRNVFLVGLDV